MGIGAFKYPDVMAWGKGQESHRINMTLQD
jgi:hypothetical protein